MNKAIFVIFMLLFPFTTFASAKPAADNEINESNCSVFAKRIKDSDKDVLFYAYKKDNKIVLQYFELEVNPNSRIKDSESKPLSIAPLPVQEDDYYFYWIDPELLLLANNKLYSLNLSKSILNMTEWEPIAENITGYSFIDDICFYVISGKSLFSYSPIRSYSPMRNENKKQKIMEIPGNIQDNYFRILDLEKIQQTKAEEWHKKIVFTKELDDNDLNLLEEYIRIKPPPNEDEIEFASMGAWRDAMYGDGYREYTGKLKERNDEKDRITRVSAGIATSSIENANQSSYTGKDSDIKHLLDIYNLTIDTWMKNMKNINNFSKETRDVISSNYKAVHNRLNEILLKRQNSITRQITDLDNNFKKSIENSLSKISVSNNSEKESFGILYINSDILNKKYVMLYRKKITEAPETAGFRKIGQKPEYIGIFGDSIYICEAGGISFYDSFTKVKTGPLVTKFPVNENILFSVDSKNFIAYYLDKNGFRQYGLYSLRYDGKTKMLVLYDQKPQTPSKARIKSAPDPFSIITIITIEENDKKDYFVNVLKDKFNRSNTIAIKGNLAYITTETGATAVVSMEE